MVRGRDPRRGPVGTGCATPRQTETDIYAAVASRSGAGGLGGLLEGRLAVENGCLWVEADAGGHYLPIWPRGTSVHGVLDGPEIVVVYRAQELVVGPRIALGGGESPSLETIDELIVEPIPAACRGGPFWSVSSVEPR